MFGCPPIFVVWLAVAAARDLRMAEVVAEYKAVCSPLQTMTVDRFKAAVRSHVTAADGAMFANATGSTIAEVLDDDAWDTMETATLLKIASGEKVVAHPLNRKGLHPLRALLAERMADSRRQRRGSTQHPFYTKLRTDGILMLPVSEAKACSPDLLRMASGYETIGDTTFRRSLEARSRDETDIQNYMHVDTHMPTWKVWVFAPTSIEDGPFHFVKGSHRNTVGKMRWLFDRTKHIVDQRDCCHPAGNTNNGLGVTWGPWRDGTHGFHPSIRFEDFDWANPRSVRKLLAAYGFPPPEPVVTTNALTLVVADTSGFHYRGLAEPNRTRHAYRLQRRYKKWWGPLCHGGVDVPRKDAFKCDELPPSC